MKTKMNNQRNAELKLNNVAIRPIEQVEKENIQKEINMWSLSLIYSMKPQNILRELSNKFSQWGKHYEEVINFTILEINNDKEGDKGKLTHTLDSLIHDAGKNLYFMNRLKEQIFANPAVLTPTKNQITNNDKQNFLKLCEKTDESLRDVIATCLKNYHQINRSKAIKSPILQKENQYTH